MTPIRLVCLAAALLCAFVGVVHAQKRPKPPSYWPATLEFRCPGGPQAYECDGADRIVGVDGGPSGNYPLVAGSGSAGTEMYASILEMHTGLLNVYSVELDFGDPVGTAPCVTTNNCRLLPHLATTGYKLVIRDAEIQTNVVDNNSQEVPNGLFSLAVGQQGRARLRFDFVDPLGRPLGWLLRFNGGGYAGADDVNVTRVAECTWELEPGPTDYAGLYSWGSVTPRGKNTRVDEGLYRMPVKVTFRTEGPAQCTT